MRYPHSVIILLVFIMSAFLQAQAQDTMLQVAKSYFSPLPKTMPDSENDTPEIIYLGKKLYFETALSINNAQSCNSCHNIIGGAAGVDNLVVSIGAKGKAGTRNALSTWNAGLHTAQLWDGRAKTLEEQARLPILNPKEMAMPSEDLVIERLKNKAYTTDFRKAFPKDSLPISLDNTSQALAAFQRTLITRDRFDDYLSGNKAAITDSEKAGLKVFIEKGCVACHNGPVLGGQLFMKMGLVHAYPNKVDLGKGGVTGNSADNYFFKVPSLRNVLNTYPYFHDGAAMTIEQAVVDTGWHQLGIKINEKDVKAIKTFFNTLSHKKQ